LAASFNPAVVVGLEPTMEHYSIGDCKSLEFTALPNVTTNSE
jgi:hypothetical protein